MKKQGKRKAPGWINPDLEIISALFKDDYNLIETCLKDDKYGK